MKKKILIISGGISKERIISLDTGKQVARELSENGYIVKISEPNSKLLNIVGFQTNLKWPEQKRIFRMIPGLEKAEFVRYGVMHRRSNKSIY